MKKLNNTTSIDGDNYWCAYYFNGDQIVVTLDDLGEMDSSLMDSNNSNIYGLSSTNTRDGWVYVRDNNVDDQFLDSCDNLDAQINAQLSEAIEARKEANAEYDNAMTLEKTLEN